MFLSAVILTYNSEKHIGACLNSLQAAVERLPAPNEIFVVDNGSSDRTREILESFEPKDGLVIHTLLLDENKGTTVTRNMALRRASGEFVLVIDSDVIVPVESIEPLIAHLKANPEVGLIAPGLIFPDGRPQLSVDRFPTVGRKLKRSLFLRSLEEDIGSKSNTPQPHSVDYAISAFWLMPHHTLDTVGLLDERFFYAPEDVDYCLSIWLAGLSVVSFPAITAIHDARERSRGPFFNRFTVRHIVGLLRFFLKWRYGLGLQRLYRRIERVQSPGATAKPVSIPGT